jgi:hypothetical protein
MTALTETKKKKKMQIQHKYNGLRTELSDIQKLTNDRQPEQIESKHKSTTYVCTYIHAYIYIYKYISSNAYNTASKYVL